MKAFKEKLKELRVVQLHDEYYLGVIKKDEIKDDVLIDAIQCGDEFGNNDIERWFRYFNIAEVYEEIKLVGSTGYTVRSFDVHEKRYAEQCLVIMEDAKRLALKQIENNHFKENMKK